MQLLSDAGPSFYWHRGIRAVVVAPGILNVATNWYTDGVMVSNISHSGVMTQIRRDALRREVARIDGRGSEHARLLRTRHEHYLRGERIEPVHANRHV